MAWTTKNPIREIAGYPEVVRLILALLSIIYPTNPKGYLQPEAAQRGPQSLIYKIPIAELRQNKNKQYTSRNAHTVLAQPKN